MKTKILAVLVIGILAAVTVRAADSDKKELDKLTGTWTAVSIEHDGKKASEEDAKKVKLTVKGEHYTLQTRDQMIEGTHKLDATKKPKQIDAMRTKGPDAGQTLKGIYELDGDTFKACFAPAGKDRPTEFATKEGDDYRLMTFKWEKP